MSLHPWPLKSPWLWRRLPRKRLLRHQQRSQRRNHKCDRHQVAQPAKKTDIARVGFMINNARRHEQRRLEGAVGDQTLKSPMG